MPRCTRCGEEKPPHKFQRKKRADGSIWVGPTCHVCSQREWRKRGSTPDLPVWPFRWWLTYKARFYDDGGLIRGRANEKTPKGIGHLASHCAGTDVEPASMERRFREILEHSRWVHFDVVDRSLINEGSTMLWELVDMAEEHVWSNGFWPIERALRRLEDLEDWRKWA